MDSTLSCPSCGKPEDLCVCRGLPRNLEHKTRILILQHPQESDRLLGSARLAQLCLSGPDSAAGADSASGPAPALKVGLSWPNLAKALGEPKESVRPARWAVLHLGSGIKTALPGKSLRPGLHFVSKSGGEIVPPEERLEGFVVLDGTWSQAKALWWRNAWLLKLKRAILVPSSPSLYRELRKEPRRECLSTIETIAETLQALGEPERTVRELKQSFAILLERQRERLRSRRQSAKT